MNRRGFLKLFGGVAAAAAAAPLIPFNRVWSFPSKIVIPLNPLLTGRLGRCFGFDYYYDEEFAKSFKIGSTIRVRLPQRFIIRDYIGDFSQPKKYLDVAMIDAKTVREVSKHLTAADRQALLP